MGIFLKEPDTYLRKDTQGQKTPEKLRTFRLTGTIGFEPSISVCQFPEQNLTAIGGIPICFLRIGQTLLPDHVNQDHVPDQKKRKNSYKSQHTVKFRSYEVACIFEFICRCYNVVNFNRIFSPIINSVPEVFMCPCKRTTDVTLLIFNTEHFILSLSNIEWQYEYIYGS